MKPIEYSDVRVSTTEQLADAYGCESGNIKKNFNCHKERFIEGIHYFKLQGAALQDFRLQVTDSDLQISPMTRSLYLWTKRRVARHSKLLGTNRALEVFDELEENYFNPVKDLSPVELLLRDAKRLVEHERAINSLDRRILELESRQLTIDKHFYTVIGYANLNGVRRINRRIAAGLGRRASSLSKELGFPIGKEYDARYGQVNTYHDDILHTVFLEYYRWLKKNGYVIEVGRE